RILAAGDFHGDPDTTKKLANKAKKESVDLVVLTGDITSPLKAENILKPFIDAGKKVVLVPGNHDSTEAMDLFSHLYGVKNIHENYAIYDNIGIFGIGSPDWQFEINDKKAYDKLKKDFDKIKEKKLEKKIMISHLHASGTKSELSGIPGNKGLRKAIDKFQPDIFLSGHIHEAEGMKEKIGKTRVYSIGRRGTIIEL
ncbi:MAG: metallophosphoesterase, partial [Candidatus Nanoarchaeia archaeon]|nr:metallophosphoesterase [Candidatus Nanoarchaeia archaeon]